MSENPTRRVSGDSGSGPAVRRGRPTGDHEAKRAELLKAAASVIAQEGYAHTSLRKVAQRAGCTTGAVTYYFANKEELVTALAETRFDSFDAMIASGRRRTDKPDIRAILERWLSRTTDDAEFWPVMSQLLLHARYEPGFAALIERRYARLREVLASLLATGQAQGTVRDDIPADLLADQLGAIGDGWMVMFPIEPERFTPTRVQALLDAAVTLISPPGSARRGSQAEPSGR
ncbi:TetR family transcriptional regulator [Streptomyces sp. NRRL F-4489]|uniref:TetR/AcrR family transcriptional regulator n=1 Tax=Streptomyces sp. NRRL F-4489 TaxID=1609095 RepID=UPI000748B16D|nr:TetR/AcrR family transcriptional regulator [Streptomyces sp. NRRL F-4489]KUL55502.1 TetR family transcriptional regulator [Streptomyces sp. NRRL F-4489]